MTVLKQAVILAGGAGTRLQPITHSIPKPMVSLNGRPFLEYLVDLLKNNGIEEIVLCLGHMHEKISEYFGDGSKFGIGIKYSIGDAEFDTGKRIKNAQKLLREKFLLMYCDNYWPLDMKKYISFYDKLGLPVSCIVYSNKDHCLKKLLSNKNILKNL